MAQHHHQVSRLMTLDEPVKSSASGQRSNNTANQVRNSKQNTKNNALLAALKSCSKTKDLERGRVLHREAIRSKQDSDIYVANSLVNMYAKCGSLVDARRVFDKMKKHTVVSWNSLLAGYAENGEEQLCLDSIAEMKSRGCAPDALTFVAAIRALTKLAGKEEGKLVNGKLGSLEKAKVLHTRAATAGFELHAYVNSSLINLYAKCGSMADARKVFDKGGGSAAINIVSWNSLMLGYVENSEPETALEMFEVLLRSGKVSADALSFVAACKACACLGEKDRTDGKLFRGSALQRGKSLHLRAAKAGFELEDFVANSLIDMYGKCGSMEDAREVFDKMRSRTVVAWNSLLLGYVENGEEDEVLELFSSIGAPQTCSPNSLTFVAALKACSSWAGRERESQVKLQALEKGRAVHYQAAECGFEQETFVANSLIDMYWKCGSMADAKRVFDRMVSRDIVSWNTLLLGYAENDGESLALELFESIKRDFTPTALTFVAALKACSNLAHKELTEVGPECLDLQLLETGKRIHGEAAEFKLDSNVYVESSLVNMYCKCGSLADSRKVFHRMRSRSVVTWNTLLLEIVDKGGAPGEVVELYQAMLQEGCTPNSLTLAAVLKACVSLAASEVPDEKLVKPVALRKGRIIHSQASEAGFDSDLCVGNTLVDFYAKCGSLAESKQVFDCIPSRSPVSWTTLMMGYVELDRGDLALELYDEMHRRREEEGCKPDAPALAAALKACSSMAAREEGLQVDGIISPIVRLKSLARGRALEQSYDNSNENTFVATAMVSLYTKCGSMPDARRVFDRVPEASRDRVLWNALLLGYIENHDEESALALFASFQQRRFQPDFATLSRVLKLCSSMEFTRKVHRCICSAGLDNDAILATSLLNAYGKCGGMLQARLVFDSLVKRDLVAWNALVGSYSRVGDAAAVMKTFRAMQDDGVAPDGVTFLSLLNACSHAGLVAMGRRCLEAMEKLGVRPERPHWECVVDLMGRANELAVALKVAEAMPFEAELVTWTILLSACERWRDEEVARAVFEKVVKLGNKEDVAAAYVLMAGIFQTQK